MKKNMVIPLKYKPFINLIPIKYYIEAKLNITARHINKICDLAQHETKKKGTIMQSLRERIGNEDSALSGAISGKTKGFALSSAFGSRDKSGRKAVSTTRPSYKAVIADGTHVKFSNGGTHVSVTNENTGKEHQLPLKAAMRYCSMIAEGKLKATEEEKKNASVLQKAVQAKAKQMKLSLGTGLTS